MGARTRQILVGVVTTTALVLATGGLAATPAGAATPADLVLTGTAPAKGLPSVPIVDTYRVTNQGGSVAADSYLDVDIAGRSVGPGQSILVSVPAGCEQVPPQGPFGSDTLHCALGDLAPGQSVTRAVAYVVATGGSYQHAASVSTASPESDTSNNAILNGTSVGAKAFPGLLGLVAQILARVLPLRLL